MLLTDSKLEELAQIMPEIASVSLAFSIRTLIVLTIEALAKLPKPAFPPTNRVKTLRHASQLYDDMILKRLRPTPPHLSETYHFLELRDGHSSQIKITKPLSGLPGPLIVLIFSGAFIAGSIEQLSQIARALTTLYSATCVSINYRLAPEHAFPTAVYDAIDSVSWIANIATGPVLDSDPSLGFILGGASSGGNLAAVLSRYFQMKPLPWALTGQWISIANLMDASSVPAQYRTYFQSREQNA
jgi:acetyl esterase/lipase